MSFISLYYLAFIAVVMLLYYLIPKKYRWIILLIASYTFYLLNDLRSVIFIIITTATVYFATYKFQQWGEKDKKFLEEQPKEWLVEHKKEYLKKTAKKKKALLACTLILNFGILFALKYFETIATAFANLINVKPLELNILLPLGISFYMFQTVGYLIDAYFGKVVVEKNIFKLALFTSFFPQLLQGPISRYNQLAPQLTEGNDFNVKKVQSGVLLMLWGYFKKLVIADRADILFASVMGNFGSYQGAEIFVAMLCFVLKLYCSFSGGIDIAMGSAECLGIDLTPNFKRPFFALSVTDYWRRWHITLGAWMKDYVLYPLTLSKGYNKFIKGCKKVFKKSIASKVVPSGIAMFFVFLLVGVWHGPDLTYLLFGVYNGIIILVETIINEVRKIKKIQPKERSVSAKRFIVLCKWTLTFMLVYFGKYFSAVAEPGINNMGVANVELVGLWFVATFKYTSFSTLFSGFLDRAGFNIVNLIILVLATIFLITIETMQERGAKIREWILNKKAIWLWIIIYVAIILLVLLTAYSGTGGGFAYEKY